MAKTEAVETNAVETEAVETNVAKTEAVEIEAVKTEKVFLPYDDTHKRPLYVCVNGRSMNIERGKEVEIPAEFAEVVRNAIQQETDAVRYSDAMAYKE
nr:MAG TPA: hypothetical protein [Caudoviricetes sp.]